MVKTRAGVPTISRVLSDGTIVELIRDSAAGTTAFAVFREDGSRETVEQHDVAEGARLVPYAAENNLLMSGCVLLASEIGEFGDIGDLVAAVRTYLHRYVDLAEDFEEIAAYYALYTWVYDAFNDAPGLRVRGDLGSGKSRFLIALGSICYKPFFASGASTVSPIFHILDAFQGVLVLDEADFRFSDATSELVKILNNGTTRGLPVLRTMTNRNKELNPTAFRVFGPKVIAMRGSFSDPALESRFITEDVGDRLIRADIPIHLPATLEAEAQQLRNRLLAWRFHARRTVAIRPERAITGVSARLNQMALPLLSIIEDEGTLRRVAARLRRGEDARREARRTTEEAAILRVLVEAFTVDGRDIPIGTIAARLSTGGDSAVSAKRLGWVVRTRLHLVTTKSRGVYVVPATEKSKAEVLARRLGILDEERGAA